MGSQVKSTFSMPIGVEEYRDSIDSNLRSLMGSLGQSSDKDDLWVMVVYPPFWNPETEILEKGVLLSNRVDALCQFYPALKKSFWLISDSGTPLPLCSREADALLYAIPQPQACRLGMITDTDSNTSDDLANAHVQVQELSAKTVWQLMPPSKKALPQSIALFSSDHVSSESAGFAHKWCLQTAVDFSESSLSDETGLGYWMTQVSALHQSHGIRLKLQVEIPFDTLDLTQENKHWSDAQKTAWTSFLIQHPDWANWVSWIPQNKINPVFPSVAACHHIYLVCGSLWHQHKSLLQLAKAGALVCLPSYRDFEFSDLALNALKAFGPVYWKSLENPSDWPKAWLSFWPDQKKKPQPFKVKRDTALTHYLDLWCWHERVLSSLSTSLDLMENQFLSFSSEGFRRQLESQWEISVENWVYHKEALGLFSQTLTDFHRFYLAFQIHFNSGRS